MEQEKDYSLLRPFDLDAAEWGEPILFGGQYEAVSFVCRSLSGKTNIIEYSEMNTGIVDRVRYASDEWLRMAPLCWVEWRPVYKGDVLYWNKNSIQYKVIATDEGFKFDDGSLRTYESVDEKSFFTWNPPKVKREWWINCYPDGENYVVYTTEERANEVAGSTRIACVRIEWEE